MEEVELTKKILDYIKILYKAEYTGYINVKKLNSGYAFEIGVPSYMMPTTFSIDVDDDDTFLKYVYEDLRTRNYMRAFYYKVNRNRNIPRDE